MSKAYTNIKIHLIFHIKNTLSLIKEEDLPRIFHYIGGIIRSKSGVAYMVGGRPDHIHILTSLPVEMGLSSFVGCIKANSSRWIKELDQSYEKFAWQSGYGAFSVSESCKDSVIKYISNQKQQHSKISMQDEFLQFLQKNGVLSDTVCHSHASE